VLFFHSNENRSSLVHLTARMAEKEKGWQRRDPRSDFSGLRRRGLLALVARTVDTFCEPLVRW
jgi:hypothetical protein